MPNTKMYIKSEISKSKIPDQKAQKVTILKILEVKEWNPPKTIRFSATRPIFENSWEKVHFPLEKVQNTFFQKK